MQIANVSRTTLDALRLKLLTTHQATITGVTQGEIDGHGVTAAYSWDGQTNELTVEVKHHPFFMPLHVIEHQLEQAVDSARSAEAA